MSREYVNAGICSVFRVVDGPQQVQALLDVPFYPTINRATKGTRMKTTKRTLKTARLE